MKKLPLIVIALLLFGAGCSNDEAIDEAYEAGYDAGVYDRGN